MREKTLREAATMALEMLDISRNAFEAWGNSTVKIDQAFDALRAALAVPDEPVMWRVSGTREQYTGEFAEVDAKDSAHRIGGECRAIALYAAHQPPTPVEPAKPLTADAILENDDLMRLNAELGLSLSQIMQFAEIIEAARGIHGAKS